MSNGIVPVSDEQAKAIQEGFKLGGQSLEAARAFGGYMARIFGTVPEDIVGLMFGDALRLKRVENIVKMATKARERLEARGVKEQQEVPLSLGLPLLEAASDEDRDELVDLWARLLAAAMDPARSPHMSARFVAVVKAMDPIDARVLWRLRSGVTANPAGSSKQSLADTLSVNPDQIQMAFESLKQLNLVAPWTAYVLEPQAPIENVTLTAAGREFLLAVGD